MILTRSFISLTGICATAALVAGVVVYTPQTGKKSSKVSEVAPSAASAVTSAAYAKEIAPLVKKYCAGCHGKTVSTAGINFEAFKTVDSVIKARGTWEHSSENLQSKRMPPAGSPTPTEAERSKMVAWIDSTLSSAVCLIKDPGRVTLRRLNREEYNNTVRDLFGITLRPADDFPSDDVGYGFDNIGDVLSVSPILMEKYLSAAEKVSKAAIWIDGPEGPPKHYNGKDLSIAGTPSNPLNNGVVLATNGEAFVNYEFPRESDYVIRARVTGQQAGPDLVKTSLKLDGTALKTESIKAEDDNGQVMESKVHLSAGKRKVVVAFLNDFYDANEKNPKRRDRNLVVIGLDIVGPLKERPNPLPESHTRLIAREPEAGKELEAARAILSNFLPRAWRRTVTADEVNRLTRYVKLVMDQGESFDRGVQVACQAALVSPNFLFHVETDPKPDDPNFKHLITDTELASRLSYFLWSSMPDDELLTLARQNKLHNPAVMSSQIKRMTKDPKARALVDNFAAQWLHLRTLAIVNPDQQRFPDFNDELKASMKRETEMYCESIFKEDRSIIDFIDSRYTFLNERLAKHYGIPDVHGDAFQRVALTGDERGGILCQGSVLTVTSNPTRTSPVKRGKYILEEILGTPPPPAPPNVPPLVVEEGPVAAETLRVKMERHRKDPGCASCHSKMDPLGFGLENFDATGGWRTKDGKQDVDSSGVLPNGKKFNGPKELKAILLSQKDKFAKCFTDRLMTFALGRGLEYYDKCAVDAIVKSSAKDSYRFSALLQGIVNSDPFRMRRGDGGQK